MGEVNLSIQRADRVMVRPLLRLWRRRDVILWRLLIGFDIRTKERILCAPLRLCVISLFTRTARTFADSFLFHAKAQSFAKHLRGKISVCYAGWGRRHMTSLRLLYFLMNSKLFILTPSRPHNLITSQPHNLITS